MSNLHPIFADILARHMQLPGMNTENSKADDCTERSDGNCHEANANRLDFYAGCWGCGRIGVKKRPRHGKLHYAHKCSHGLDCVAGHRLAGIQGNNWPRCPDCRIEARKQHEGRASLG